MTSYFRAGLPVTNVRIIMTKLGAQFAGPNPQEQTQPSPFSLGAKGDFGENKAQPGQTQLWHK
jgi:hypothetical protein